MLGKRIEEKSARQAQLAPQRPEATFGDTFSDRSELHRGFAPAGNDNLLAGFRASDEF
jgi:hypothetical protein